MAQNGYMATLKIHRLDGTREELNTTVKAQSLDGLKRKVNGLLELMDEDDLMPGSAATR